MNRPEFGTDGVRGKFGENLTLQFVYVLGRAIARVLGVDRPFDIGRDTRTSGMAMFCALRDGIEREGGIVHDLEIISTPGIATLAKLSQNPACAITASHNPATDNGVKVFGSGGIKIDTTIEKKIEQEIDGMIDEPVPEISSYSPPAVTGASTAVYLQYLTSCIHGEDLDGLKVVLDCANGAAYSIAPSVFQMLGAKVTAINTESDGVRINDNCGATHLTPLIEKVKEIGADIGFAFDGDADRVIAVDHKGNVCDGDYIMALFAIDMKDKGLLTHNTVVATVMSNGALRSYLKENDIDLSEVSVGDKYVLEEILNKGFSLGGEQSGHIIRTDIATWGDGVVNALLLSQIVCSRKRKLNKSVSEIIRVFEPMVQYHDKVRVKNKELANSSKAIVSAIEAEKASLGESSRVIIRPSGTEDVVRITVEGLSEMLVRESLLRLRKIVEEECK